MILLICLPITSWSYPKETRRGVIGIMRAVIRQGGGVFGTRGLFVGEVVCCIGAGWLQFYNDYGDIIKATLGKSREISKVMTAKTLAISLTQVRQSVGHGTVPFSCLMPVPPFLSAVYDIFRCSFQLFIACSAVPFSCLLHVPPFLSSFIVCSVVPFSCLLHVPPFLSSFIVCSVVPFSCLLHVLPFLSYVCCMFRHSFRLFITCSAVPSACLLHVPPFLSPVYYMFCRSFQLFSELQAEQGWNVDRGSQGFQAIKVNWLKKNEFSCEFSCEFLCELSCEFCGEIR